MAVDKTNITTLHVEEKPYTTLINDVVQGLQNPDALAIWVYLQSKSSGWRVIASHIQSHFGIGRQRYRAAMRCLHAEGLITYTSQRNAMGQLEGKEIIVHWRPKIEHQPNVQETERSVRPTLGETTPYEIQESFTKGEIETKRSSRDELVGAAFDVFWNAGMRKQDKQRANSAFVRLAKAHGDPMAFAESLAADIAGRKACGQFGFDKMLPSTYLNQKRWEDERPSDCPHQSIIAAWNDEMPRHIVRVDPDGWLPDTSGHARLVCTWEALKVKPRRDGTGMVVQSTNQGAEWFRGVFRRLAKSPRLLDETSAQWCKMSWAVKTETVFEIAQGAYDQ